MQPPRAYHWWSRHCEGDLTHELVPGHGGGGSIRQLQIQVRSLSRGEPDWSRVLDGYTGSTDSSIGPVPQQGSLDRTSFNSIWRRVSIQVSVSSREAPRSSASATHVRSAALWRPAIQCTTTQSPCHRVRAMRLKTSPQSPRTWQRHSLPGFRCLALQIPR